MLCLKDGDGRDKPGEAMHRRSVPVLGPIDTGTAAAAPKRHGNRAWGMMILDRSGTLKPSPSEANSACPQMHSLWDFDHSKSNFSLSTKRDNCPKGHSVSDCQKL